MVTQSNLRTALASLGGWLPRRKCAEVVGAAAGSFGFRPSSEPERPRSRPSSQKRCPLGSSTPAGFFNSLGLLWSARFHRLGQGEKLPEVVSPPAQVVARLGALAGLSGCRHSALREHHTTTPSSMNICVLPSLSLGGLHAPCACTTHSGCAVVRGSLRSFGVAAVVVSGPRSLGAALATLALLLWPRPALGSASLSLGRRSYCRPSPSPAATPHSLLSPLSLGRAPRLRGLPCPRTPAARYARGLALWGLQGILRSRWVCLVGCGHSPTRHTHLPLRVP